MDVFKPIKLYLGQHLLNRELKNFYRTQRIYNLDLAETIGIIYEYKNEEEFKVVGQLINQLYDEKKRVKAMVYIKETKLLRYIPQRLTVDYIRPNDIDWFYRPHSTYVSDFINSRFHILIDLNFNRAFPLNYIVSLSRAYYKVGVFHENNKKQLDLLIKMDPERGLNYVVREIIRYLKVINPR